MLSTFWDVPAESIQAGFAMGQENAFQAPAASQTLKSRLRVEIMGSGHSLE
jgi:hypothetical protein